ncbi:MAG: bacteriohemerythrin [Humidesulfovibrio sp.]|nr:bacteriohemerythrin [Humidesulfovibrio sp.]
MHTKPIEWDRSLMIGNEMIDGQHQHLFDTFENLRRATQGLSKEAESTTCISEMLKYVNSHFADEESHMKMLGFRGLEAHKALHKEFIDKVNDYTDSCSSGYVPYADMLEFLVKWLTEHIMVEDKKITS